MDLDIKPLETEVYVHSPLSEYSSKGEYYTSYAIHLMTNNPAFTHTTSHTRRRYSEFITLRQLLKSHYPIRPPNLPPKNFFQRFSNEFIEERMKGLQNFLTAVLATPIYLSDKSLHLFLQSSCSMSKINEECLGDIPAPPLLTPLEIISSFSSYSSYSDSSSSGTSDSQEVPHMVKSLRNLVIEDIETSINMSCETLSDDIIPECRTSASPSPQIRDSEQFVIPKANRYIKSCHSMYSCNSLMESVIPKYRPPLSSSLQIRDSKQFMVLKKGGSVESSPSSSSSSLDSSYSSLKPSPRDRHVSFSERVQIAIVTNSGICILTQ